MPWNFRKVGNKTCAYNKATGKKKGCTTGSAKAYKAALYANALEEKKTPNKITQKDVMAGVRKSMPPPAVKHKDKKTYNRKKFKTFKAFWDENIMGVDGSQMTTDDTTATAEAVYAGSGGDQDSEPNVAADIVPGSEDAWTPLKNEDEDSPGGPDVNAAPETENFIDHKGPGKPGDSKRHGIKKHSSLSALDKIVHSKTASPRKKQLAHWQANMRRGRAKK